MRVLIDYQDGAVMQSYLHAAQYSSLAARARDAWNEWEINCLVMASFSLQVFLLLSAPFRKRHRSSMLSGSLWLAYLLADYVATYVLGRLTLLLALAGNDRRHQLALFWAPFLLLHLGGQETITAFSMEDSTLWKRRLLDLVAQVAMAVYVVAKQWRGGDRLLVAPMVLMFVSAAVKYGERIWALRAAAERTPGSRSIARLADRASNEGHFEESAAGLMAHYRRLVNISSQDKIRIERILEDASIEFPASLDFFMDVTPSDVSGFHGKYHGIESALMELKSSKNGDGMAYKLAEVQASLIHDYLYTKFGTVRFQAPKSNPTMGGALQWLCSLSLTSVALVLFAWATSASSYYSGADVLISYILLVGAIVMEISSIFIALISSCWAGTGVAKHLHLHVGEWSGKLAQYNMVDACVQEKERERQAAAGVIGTAIRRMLASSPPHVVVSPEVKKLLLNKVLEIATNLRSHDWDFSRFQGQWAQWVAGDFGPAHMALSTSKIQELNFVSSVILWHLVTSICLLAGDGPAEFTNPSKELSNYIMYLVAKRSVMVDSDGHVVLTRTRKEVQGSEFDFLRQVGDITRDVPAFLDEFQQEGFIQKLREGDKEYESQVTAVRQSYRAATTARRVCVELLKIPEARDRWELIAAVWTEILCYMALNCGAAFHAKHLTTGGEFLTQAKMLLFVIRLPFLRNSLVGGLFLPEEI
ncbi:unnamed protein product [Alopecurus aequalis]